MYLCPRNARTVPLRIDLEVVCQALPSGPLLLNSKALLVSACGYGGKAYACGSVQWLWRRPFWLKGYLPFTSPSFPLFIFLVKFLMLFPPVVL
ncbi:hypothetical protein TorRG33x02_288310 [Trema orientale]|uniref:Uncharacterized protein n=1 Tax=Trema orientale TaxID=63057 RepID=A0A2P5CEB3_TREOI|nr:hypothetical protein TorRG33x02_288310 [Trema orientale]